MNLIRELIYFVSSFSLSISASFCFKLRLTMTASFLAASIDSLPACTSALSCCISTNRKGILFFGMIYLVNELFLERFVLFLILK